MPILSQGASIDLAVNGDSTLTLQSPVGGFVTVENPVGTVIWRGGQSSRQIDVKSGTVRITANTRDVDYALNTDPLNGIPVLYDPLTGQMSANGSPVSGAGILGDDRRKLFDNQPFGITKPVLRPGRMFSDFSGTRLTAVSAPNVTITRDYSGYDVSNNPLAIQARDGLPSMVRIDVTNDATQQFQITNALLGSVTLVDGKLGLWVFYDATNKVSASGVSLGMDLFNATSYSGNNTRVAFGPNQMRHGWNFLVYKQLYASPASQPSNEQHFPGLSVLKSGAGADLVGDTLKYINIDVGNANGCSFYFASMWTDFDQLPTFTIGCDQATSDTASIALPKFQQYGWKGYFAAPFRVWSSGSKIVNDYNNPPPGAQTRKQLYDSGWDCINHTLNHLANGSITAPGELRYEIEGAKSWYLSDDMTRGGEFYASPQSSTSRLAETVIAASGIGLQRHGANAHINCHVTQFGIDNPRSVGSVDMSNATAGYQQFSKIKAVIDRFIAYRCSGHLFWHVLTTLGDTGSGEDLTGNDLTMTKSAFDKTLDYLAQLEAAGQCRITDGFTGFYYGVGR
jgi:hypothetical protein